MTTLIESIDRKYIALHRRSVEFVEIIPDELLFKNPQIKNRRASTISTGECILRSAGKVEQSFGGITARLWDDPFEWTLPESLFNTEKVLEYLGEVEKTRRKGFAFFNSDDDLKREIPAPEQLKTIFDILLETICFAEHFQGRAFAVFQMFSDEKLPRI